MGRWRSAWAGQSIIHAPPATVEVGGRFPYGTFTRQAFQWAVDEPLNSQRALLHLDCVLPDLTIRTPMQAFGIAAQALAAVHGIGGEALAQRLSHREGRGSTALGAGVAMPHADAWGTTRPLAAYIRSSIPIDFFPTVDRGPVHDVLVLVAPRPATGVHHQMLLHYRALLTDPDFQARLHECEDRQAIWQLWREREWNRDPHRLAAAIARPAKRRHRATASAAEEPLTAS